MEKENQIGKLISYERNRAGMGVKELGRGLCSHTFLLRVESGERVCEKILADSLLQRAGVSADKFVYMINPDEQDWMVLREKLIAAVDEGNEVKAFPLIEEYYKMTRTKSKLHIQLLFLLQVVLSWKNKRDTTVMLGKLNEAWAITMQGIPMKNLNSYSLTVTEFVLGMMYYRISEDRGSYQTAAKGYEQLLLHLEMFADEEDSVKLYPQIAYRLSGLYLKDGRTKEAVELAEKSIALLKVRGRLFYLRQFLEIISKYGENTPKEREEAKQICESLKWLYQTYGVEEEVWIWNIPYGMAEVELCGNLIRSRRETLGMSQETLAEGICDPVSISRIECGKVTPKRQIFKKLMERVGMTGGNFEMVVQVERPGLLELAVKIGVLLSHSKGREAEPLIAELESEMKWSDKFSRQYLLHVKALALFNQKKIDVKQHASMQEEALYLTLPRVGIDRLAKWSFSRQEVSIINALSYSYEKMGKQEEIIALLQIIQQQYESKPFELIHYVVGYELTMRNLGNVYGNIGKYEEATKAAHKGILLGLQAGRGAILGTTLYDCGWDMEQMWQSGAYSKKESLPYVKASYALNLLFGRESENQFFVEHIKEKYNE